MKCGAIYYSKVAGARTIFKTEDPKCETEEHSTYDENGEINMKKIYICPDLYQLEQEHEDEQHQEWVKEHPDFENCHLCGTKHPTPLSKITIGMANEGWRWGCSWDDGVYSEKVVCDDCYFTSPQYAKSCPPLAKERYLAKKSIERKK